MKFTVIWFDARQGIPHIEWVEGVTPVHALLNITEEGMPIGTYFDPDSHKLVSIPREDIIIVSFMKGHVPALHMPERLKSLRDYMQERRTRWSP